jgi:hypothetical protein
VRISVYPVDAIRIEGTGTTDNAVNLVALFQQEARQVGTILSCNAGDDSLFHEIYSKALRIPVARGFYIIVQSQGKT